jgi:hypothetical protein
MDNKTDNNKDRNPVATVLGCVFLIIGLYFALMLFTDTDGLNFLNYCIPTLSFLILGAAVLFFSKPSKPK